MRMGIGVTGYLQATEKQREWLSETYEALREFDKEYSERKGFPPSIKLTTTKPSGTLSLLPGVTPGCHPAYGRYLFRRMRVASNHAVVDVCRESGYDIEFQKNFDGTEDHGTVVITFPFSYPEGTKVAAEMTAIDQLEVVRRLQAEWSDNAVSCTVYYKDEELPAIQEYLKTNYNRNFKSLSFLRHTDHGFLQAPIEEVTKEEYEEYAARVKPITQISESLELDSDAECDNGACPIR